jgi:hypothetical protein
VTPDAGRVDGQTDGSQRHADGAFAVLDNGPGGRAADGGRRLDRGRLGFVTGNGSPFEHRSQPLNDREHQRNRITRCVGHDRDDDPLARQDGQGR